MGLHGLQNFNRLNFLNNFVEKCKPALVYIGLYSLQIKKPVGLHRFTKFHAFCSLNSIF